MAKVGELTGMLLDYWVAKAEGHEWRCPWMLEQKGMEEWQSYERAWGNPTKPYSTEWEFGGPIIERDQIFLQPPTEVHYNGGPNNGWKRYDHWRATVSARTRTLPPKNEFQEEFNVRGVGRGAGETPLLAAMRAKVASHYGDEVPDAPAPNGAAANPASVLREKDGGAL